jgi:hypothetical protein
MEAADERSGRASRLRACTVYVNDAYLSIFSFGAELLSVYLSF